MDVVGDGKAANMISLPRDEASLACASGLLDANLKVHVVVPAVPMVTHQRNVTTKDSKINRLISMREEEIRGRRKDEEMRTPQ